MQQASPEEMLDWGRKVLAAQPFSAVIGAELLAFSAAGAELAIWLRPEHRQQNGFVHGGVIAYAADNTLTYAGGGALGPHVLTSEFKINFVRPAQGERLIARATVVYAGGSQAVCRCDVFVAGEGRESLCATAQGTIVRMTDPDSR
jgi:uncharacterized protein (TIGR00369 family)